MLSPHLQPRSDNLVWIDLEMTGLNPDTDAILEVAIVITNNDLEPQDSAMSLVIHATENDYAGMSAWCIEHHTRSGLLAESQRSTLSVSQAQQLIGDYIAQWCLPGTAPLCGNSVHQDKAFLRRLMPKVHDLLHYRIIDVSTVKELVRRWYIHTNAVFTKKESHRAAADIHESIAELRYYREHFFTRSL